MQTFSIGRYTVRIFSPENESPHLVYLHASPEDGAAIWNMIAGAKPALAVISGHDWNRDFSPWPASRVFSKGDDFAGGGREYLRILSNEIIPTVESGREYPLFRSIAGYSLAGLFSLWSALETDFFDSAAAISPSLWFDGFSDYLNEKAAPSRLRRVCMSLGDTEKKTRNPRMARVEQAILSAVDRLETMNIETHFHFNSGGHFNEVNQRLVRGIDWLSCRFNES